MQYVDCGPVEGGDAGPLAVDVRGLVKSYSGTQVVGGIDLAIRQGEVFALLGPNGAGKTTTVEILEGYRTRDHGEVSVLGVDPGRQRARLKSRIGIVLQSTGIDRYLTVRETIAMYASFYPRPRPVDEVIDLVGLEEKRTARVLKLSGGQQRRLDVAIAPGRQPRTAVPRRADHRLRPVGPARGVGSDQEPGDARHDGAADHALHGRGAVPRRPGRGDRGRPDRRRGPARHARRPSAGQGADPVPPPGRRDSARTGCPRPRGRTATPRSRRTTLSRHCTSSPGGPSITGPASTGWR